MLVSGSLIGEARTNTAGAFSIDTRQTPAEGAWTLTIDAGGFLPVTRSLPAADAAKAPLAIQLQIAPYRQSIEVGADIVPYEAVLDMSGVRESAAKDVGEALAALDGVTKIRKGGIANDLVIRGFQQNNIAVLVDGSRTYGACPGHMDPPSQHVDFAEVDHVELTKGAFDVMNQGGLGAVVNIVTKSPANGFSLKPSFSLGSFGYYNPSLTAAYGSDRFRVLGGYSFRTSDPYRDGSGRPVTAYNTYSAAGRAERSFDVNTGWIETEFAPSDRQRLVVGYTRQQAGLILYPYLTMDSDYDNADRATLRYSIRDLAGAVRAVRVMTYYTAVRHFMSNTERASAPNGVWTMASDAFARTIGGRVETDLGRNVTAGAESYARTWNVIALMTMPTKMRNPTIPDVDTRTAGAFLTYHRSLTERIRINGGLRFDHASTHLNTAGVSTDLYYQFHGTRQTSKIDNYPSGNLRLSIALPGTAEFFVGAGTTGRVPDGAERYFRRGAAGGLTVGDPLLPITRNTEFSTGLNIKHGRFYLRPDLFHSWLNNYITVNNQIGTTGATARSYTNIDARIYGGELSYGYSFSDSLSLAGGGSYSRGTNTIKPAAGVLSTNLAEMPPLRGWTSLRYARRWAFAEVGTVATNRQSNVSTDLKERPTAGYAIMNLKLGLTFRKLSASFSLDNLLNRFYYEHLSYYRDPFAAGVKIPEPGRQVFVQLRYSL